MTQAPTLDIGECGIVTQRLPVSVLVVLLATLFALLRPVAVEAQEGDPTIRVPLNLVDIVDVVHSPAAGRVAVVGSSEVLFFDERGNPTGRIGGLVDVVDAEVSGTRVVIAAAGTEQFVVVDLETATEVRRIPARAQKVSSLAIVEDTIWFAHGPDQFDGGIGRVRLDGTSIAETYIVSIRAHSIIDVVAARPDSVFAAQTKGFPANLGRYETDGTGTSQTTHHYHETFRPFTVAPSGETVIALNNGAFVELDADTLRRTGLAYEVPSPWEGRALAPELNDSFVTVAAGPEIITYRVGDPVPHRRAHLVGDVLGFATDGNTIFAATGFRANPWEPAAYLQLWVTHRSFVVPPTIVELAPSAYGTTELRTSFWRVSCFSSNGFETFSTPTAEIAYGANLEIVVPPSPGGCAAYGVAAPNQVLSRFFWNPDLGTWRTHNVVEPARVALRFGTNTIELLDIYPNPFWNPEYFVLQQYADILDREPREEEFRTAVDALRQGRKTDAQVVSELIESDGFLGAIAPVTRLYLAYFGRWPDDPGLSYWLEVNRGGYGLASISTEFANSPEFANTYGDLDDGAFVDLVYLNVLRRTPDPSGRAYWMDQLDDGMTRGQLMLAFSESLEYRNATNPRIAVRAAYKGLLNREPDPSGWDYWESHYQVGGSLDALAHSFLTGDEYARRFDIANQQ